MERGRGSASHPSLGVTARALAIKQARWTPGATSAAVLATVISLACQDRAQTVRAELVATQSSWTRELGTLKARHAALAARFGAKAPGGAAGTNASPATARTRAVLDGSAQSIVDVAAQARQVGPRIEAALAINAEAGERGLTEERERMAAQLQAVAADLRAADRALDELGHAESANAIERTPSN